MQHVDMMGDPTYDIGAFIPNETGQLRLYKGGGKGSPKLPEQKIMPVADDEAMRKAKRNDIARLMERSGRNSTILSEGGDKLGGG